MSKVAKTLEKVLRGNADANIPFGDLCTLLLYLGFVERTRGDHHIFTRGGVAEILNLQPRSGKAKPYQVKASSRGDNCLRSCGADRRR